jgi:hypothetical protein
VIGWPSIVSVTDSIVTDSIRKRSYQFKVHGSRFRVHGSGFSS